MLRTLLAVALLVMARSGLAETPQVVNYFGSIGENLAVSMALGTDRQMRVSGSYVYSQYGKPISLTGSLAYWTTDHTDINMKETNPGAGAFELTIAKDGCLSGTWRSSDGKRTSPVSFIPAAKTITLVSGKSDRYEIRTGYLQLTATTPLAKAFNAHSEKSGLDSHNKTVQSFMADIDEELAEGPDPTLPHTSECTPFLLYASDTLISIRNLLHTYTGGIHGSWDFGPENYVWARGALVEIKPEMIVPESQWPALREMCIKELKAQGAAWPQDIKFDKKGPPQLNFTGHGLLVIFNPYEASSYADGAYIVSLPYAEVRPLIGAGSPVAALSGMRSGIESK